MASLLPLLSESTSSPRVLSVLVAGKEGPFNLSDLELRVPSNYSMSLVSTHMQKMCVLSMSALAKAYPKVSFVSTFPGVVQGTTILDKMTDSLTGAWSVLGFGGKWIFIPLLHKFAGITLQEAGQRGLDEALGERYNIEQNNGQLPQLNENGDDAAKVGVLDKYLANRIDKIVYDHTMTAFEHITKGKRGGH